MMNHKAMQVRCTMDEPMQLLIDKLSSKSSDLYIFWQNYSQLYHAYNQKNTEIQRLQLQNDQLKREKTAVKVAIPAPEEDLYKDRCKYMEKSVEQFKFSLQKLQGDYRKADSENRRYHQENIQLQTLLHELRNQNAIQKKHIEKILEQLRNAQNQTNTMTKVYEELGQKEVILGRYASNERELKDQITELQSQIEELRDNQKQTKIQYQRLIRESMINAKNKVIQSLPGLLQTSKTRVHMVNQ